MFLGSYGFPGLDGCDIVGTGWEKDMLDTILNDPRIAGAAWWSYNLDYGIEDHQLTSSDGSLNAIGILYQSYRTK